MSAAVLPQPTEAEEWRLNELHTALKHARADLRTMSRAYTNGVRYGAHESTQAHARAAYAEAAAEANAIVAEINALTAPYRAALAAQQRAVAVQRREERRAQERAQLRAATCEGCGTIHAGEC